MSAHFTGQTDLQILQSATGQGHSSLREQAGNFVCWALEGWGHLDPVEIACFGVWGTRGPLRNILRTLVGESHLATQLTPEYALKDYPIRWGSMSKTLQEVLGGRYPKPSDADRKSAER